jgi:predicted O-methyltransferase YrrM
LIDRVDGMLTDNEGLLFYILLQKNCNGKDVIVEIDSWKGNSTIWLGYGSKRGNMIKIYVIDPHTGSSEHQKIYGKVWNFEEFKKYDKC